tara:strand:+ start:181 stop:600 length:420 start_codon:yes stop_codon:yes gene_type:complete
MTTTLTTSRGASLLLRRFSNATTTTTTYKDALSFFFSSSSPQKRFHPPRHHYTHYYGTQTKGGSYFSQGTQTGRNGVLFGETPPKEGQKRVRESWEAPYFITAALTAGILYFGLNAKPNSSLVDWAKEEAKKRLDDDER